MSGRIDTELSCYGIPPCCDASAPSLQGDGTFHPDNAYKLAQPTDGTSKAIIVGEHARFIDAADGHMNFGDRHGNFVSAYPGGVTRPRSP